MEKKGVSLFCFPVGVCGGCNNVAGSVGESKGRLYKPLGRCGEFSTLSSRGDWTIENCIHEFRYPAETMIFWEFWRLKRNFRNVGEIFKFFG